MFPRSVMIGLAASAAVACSLPPGAPRDAGPTDAAIPDAGPGDDGAGDAGDASVGIPFRDVTAVAGLGFINELIPNGYIGSGLCWLDADSDGDDDLFYAGDAVHSRFYRNDGDGTFTDATAGAGLASLSAVWGCAAADIDNDGDPDLYVLRTLADRLYLNSAGTFTDASATWGLDPGETEDGTVAAFGDVNNDGRLDLFVGTYVKEPAANQPFPEIYRGSSNHLLINDGSRLVEDASAPVRIDDPTLAAAFVDIDDDGDIDLWVVNDFGLFHAPDRLFVNHAGRLTESAASYGLATRIFGMGAMPGDADGDGDVDLYETNLMSHVLHVQGANGRFTDGAAAAGLELHGFVDPTQGMPEYRTYDPLRSQFDAAMYGFMAAYTKPTSGEWGTTGWGGVFFDYDHDTVIDLFVAHGRVASEELVPEGIRQPDMLMRGTGAGRYAPAGADTDAWDRREARGVAASDYDNDGDLDLAVGVAPMPAPATSFLLRNELQPSVARNWLKLRLRGTTSNRDGIGARVRVTTPASATTPALTQTQHRFGGGSFASTGTTTMHFGLGPATSASIEIRWPSGRIDTFPNVPATTTLVAIEGTGN